MIGLTIESATSFVLNSSGQYDYATIHAIVDSTPVLHVSFPPADDEFPVILPMLGCTGSFETYGKSEPGEQSSAGPGSFPEDSHTPKEDQNVPKTIYLHGSATARLFKTTNSERLPVCVAATTVQGIVLALSPFHNSCNYASAVVHGYASAVTDEAECVYALTRITDNLVPERWQNSRSPPTKSELTSTGVIRVEVVSASAKVRVGGPSDDRHDLKNDEVVNGVWTGVVPCWNGFGEPVASDYNKVQQLPGYLREWIDGANKSGQQEAQDAIKKQKK